MTRRRFLAALPALAAAPKLLAAVPDARQQWLAAHPYTFLVDRPAYMRFSKSYSTPLFLFGSAVEADKFKVAMMKRDLEYYRQHAPAPAP